MHSPIPVSHHLYSLRDQDGQPGSTTTGTFDAVSAAPTTTPDVGPCDMELDRVARNLWDMIVRGHPLPVFNGF